MDLTDDKQIETLEIRLLLEAMRLRYGYDFSGYTPDTLRRRLQRNALSQDCDRIGDMIGRVLHEPDFFDRIVYDLSITVTEMFRDPSFYIALRRDVLPTLAQQSRINIWHAGCATGEEVYSMAILLSELDLYDKVQIYATDINEAALRQAREGIYPLGDMRSYTANYQQAGGIESFADYYHADYGSAKMQESLKRNIIFANHNLVADGPFAEMHVILCRNVLIYFGKELQNTTFGLFRHSLVDDGYLCLGRSESLRFSSVAGAFDEVSPDERIYRKRRTVACCA